MACLTLLITSSLLTGAAANSPNEDFLKDWLDQFALHYGYLGVFVVSILGASTVIVPIPYTLIIYALGGVFEPILLALSAGLGSAAGEFTGYILGYFGRRAINEKHKRRVAAMLKLFNRHGRIVIFLFALTPLPDDLLFIPLGIMRFSPAGAFIPALIGKILMCLLLAYAGKASFGLVLEAYGKNSFIGVVITIVALAAVIYGMMRIDWERLAEKYGKAIVEKSEAADKKVT